MSEKQTKTPSQDQGTSQSGRKSGSAALVIVESPAKAKTISKYLGSGFVVESSIGHIRDLPSTAAEIPAEVKAENWARIGVDVDNDFRPLYIVPAKKKAQVAKLKSLVKNASTVYLATDEDREGEAIAWHLREVLHPKVPVKRMVFDEITQTAIQAALANPRELDEQLVEAQEARRILDRLYGYEVSPVLWRKIGPKLSAGRVQSVATRLIVNRERERMRFVASEYWDVESILRTLTGQNEQVFGRMIELGGKRVATGKDFTPQGQFTGGQSTLLVSGKIAQAIAQDLGLVRFTVKDIAEKPFTQRAYPPFITSTLQQEAARKLRFTVARTMRLAQGLYENGYITYMRTDSTHLSSQAINAARTQVAELYGNDYLPDKPRVFTAKAKGAQEAHEAIRPAGESFRTPKDVRGELDPDQFALYELIWKRTVACQMKDAVGQRTTVHIEAPTRSHGPAVFSSSGKVITFAGFLRAYVEGADDPDAELADQERVLPALQKGQQLDPVKIEPKQHETTPPARFTEASLIKELEDRGIGRPSTYATIIQTIQDRGYVWKKGTALVPTFTAFAVVKLLESHFTDLVDFEFTAKMENDLDAIAAGKLAPKPWLQVFYFGKSDGTNGHQDVTHIGLKRRIGSGWEEIDAREISSIPLGQDEQGQTICARIGRYGPYIQIGDSGVRANIPDTIAPDELSLAAAKELLAQAATGDRAVGQDPATGKPVFVKNGRFGPYVQLGEAERTESGKLKRGGKPKMASLWPGMTEQTLTLEQALMLLSFPRVVGQHPQTGEEITVQDGKYGPYVKMGTETRSLESHEQLASIDLKGVLDLLAQPKKGRRGGPARGTATELGTHPQSGAKLQIKSGRFGPYVTDGVVNASLPKGMDPAKVTVEKAVELLHAREDKLREQGKDPRAPKPEKKRSPRPKKAAAAKS
jgi:DNA topoisomerase-1